MASPSASPSNAASLSPPHTVSQATMPTAVATTYTLPATTVTRDRDGPRPLRHHSRSHSSDDVPSAAGMYASARSSLQISPAKAMSLNARRNSRDGSTSASAPLPLMRRPRLMGFTPAHQLPRRNDGGVRPKKTSNHTPLTAPLLSKADAADHHHRRARKESASVSPPPTTSATAPRTVRTVSPPPSSPPSPAHVLPTSPASGPPASETSSVEFPCPTGTGAASAHSTQPLHAGSRRAMHIKAADGTISALHLDLASVVQSPPPTTHAGPVVRKKSGEPVKSSLKSGSWRGSCRGDWHPALGSADAVQPFAFANGMSKSAPTTPCLSSKAVHFDTQLEHVKLFLAQQRPAAVSRTGSPVNETETEDDEFPFYIRRRRSLGSPAGGGKGSSSSTVVAQEDELQLSLPNFPLRPNLDGDKDVYLERIGFSDDKRAIKGVVRVRNLAFEKWVAVRFTFDRWNTVSEVSAEHAESLRGGKEDRFQFSVKLHELLVWKGSAALGRDEVKTMSLCVRYTSSGREFWDNNDGQNYRVEFRRVPFIKRPSTPTSLSVSPIAATPFSSSSSSSAAAAVSRAQSVPASAFVGLHRGSRGFPMAELRRELDRLARDDDDDDDDDGRPLPRFRSLAKDAAKLAGSGAVRPGRSSTATESSGSGSSAENRIWSARYDFSTAPLQLHKTVDSYFTPNPNTSTGPFTRGYQGSAAFDSPTFDANAGGPTGPPSSTDVPLPPGFFARGALSPGLGEVVAHRPGEPSPSLSPSPSSGGTPATGSPASSSPTVVAAPLPSLPPPRSAGAVAGAATDLFIPSSSPSLPRHSSPSQRFNSFPPNRLPSTTQSAAAAWSQAVFDRISGSFVQSPVQGAPEGLVTARGDGERADRGSMPATSVALRDDGLGAGQAATTGTTSSAPATVTEIEAGTPSPDESSPRAQFSPSGSISSLDSLNSSVITTPTTSIEDDSTEGNISESPHTPRPNNAHQPFLPSISPAAFTAFAAAAAAGEEHEVRASIGSTSYADFVDRFCFFQGAAGPGGGAGAFGVPSPVLATGGAPQHVYSPFGGGELDSNSFFTSAGATATAAAAAAAAFSVTPPASGRSTPTPTPTPAGVYVNSH